MAVALTGKIVQVEGPTAFKLVDGFNAKYIGALEVDNMPHVGVVDEFLDPPTNSVRNPAFNIGLAALRLPQKNRTSPIMLLWNKNAYIYKGAATLNEEGDELGDVSWGDESLWERIAEANLTEVQGNSRGNADKTTDPTQGGAVSLLDGMWWIATEDYSGGSDYSEFVSRLAAGQNASDITINSWLWYNSSLSGFVIISYKLNDSIVTSIVGDLIFNTSKDTDSYSFSQNPLGSDEYPASQDQKGGATAALQSIQDWGRKLYNTTQRLQGQSEVTYPSGTPSSDSGVNEGDIKASNVQISTRNNYSDNPFFIPLATYLGNNFNEFIYNTGYDELDDDSGAIKSTGDIIDYLGTKMSNWELGALSGGVRQQPKLLPAMNISTADGYYLTRLNASSVGVGVLNSDLVNRPIWQPGAQNINRVVVTDGDGKFPPETIPDLSKTTNIIEAKENDYASFRAAVNNDEYPDFKGGDGVLIKDNNTDSSFRPRNLYLTQQGVSPKTSRYYLVSPDRLSYTRVTDTENVLETSRIIYDEYSGSTIDTSGGSDSVSIDMQNLAELSYDLAFDGSNLNADVTLNNTPDNCIVSLRVFALSDGSEGGVSITIPGASLYTKADGNNSGNTWNVSLDTNQYTYIVIRVTTSSIRAKSAEVVYDSDYELIV